MRIIVVGGGAAGMMAAIRAGDCGADVLLLEKNEKLGKKIYITGKGRCNLTNAASMDVFQRKIPRNARFLYSAFSALDNRGLMALIEENGVPLKVEHGDRVFPVSDHSSDIIAALQRALRVRHVEVMLNTAVRRLLIEGTKCTGVELDDGQKLISDAVILATGGMSYPATGSTGDGYRMAEAAQHHIEPLHPSLVPIDTEESWPGTLAGLTLKNVRLSAYRQNGAKEKRIFSELGEMLFTHTGVSGPLVLMLSSLIASEDLKQYRMSIDLKPALDEQTLDQRMVRDFQAAQRKQIASVMDGLTPHQLGLQILLLAHIPPTLPVHSVTVEQRHRILHLLKDIPLTPKALRDFNEAIVTRGGVRVGEIDPSTMQSRLIEDLYFAGELIDVDGMTGGFNLQIAFSTGALAGQSAATAST